MAPEARAIAGHHVTTARTGPPGQEIATVRTRAATISRVAENPGANLADLMAPGLLVIAGHPAVTMGTSHSVLLKVSDLLRAATIKAEMNPEVNAAGPKPLTSVAMPAQGRMRVPHGEKMMPHRRSGALITEKTALIVIEAASAAKENNGPKAEIVKDVQDVKAIADQHVATVTPIA
jgi:hypothetical protein